MRSKRLDSNPELEENFKIELSHLNRQLERLSVDDPQLRNLKLVSLRYVDELNKVRKYRAPLSVSVLLSALMEALLNYICIQKQNKVLLTKAWKKTIERQQRNPKSPKHPYLAELIEVVDEMALLRSQGLQDKLISLYLANPKNVWITDNPAIREAFQKGSNFGEAKGNYKSLHEMRELRNAVHPMTLIESDVRIDGSEFEAVLWRGLRLLLILEHLMGFESKVQTSNPWL